MGISPARSTTTSRARKRSSPGSSISEASPARRGARAPADPDTGAGGAREAPARASRRGLPAARLDAALARRRVVTARAELAGSWASSTIGSSARADRWPRSSVRRSTCRSCSRSASSRAPRILRALDGLRRAAARSGHFRRRRRPGARGALPDRRRRVLRAPSPRRCRPRLAARRRRRARGRDSDAVASLCPTPERALAKETPWPRGCTLGSLRPRSPSRSRRSPGLAAGDWPFYGGDAGGIALFAARPDRPQQRRATREAWRIRTGDLDVGPPPPGHMAFQATPILVGDLLVLPTPLGRVLALDPETGAERWRFDATARRARCPSSPRAASRAGRTRRRGPARLPAAHLRDHHRVAPVRDRRRERPRLSRLRSRGRGEPARRHRRGPGLGVHDLVAAGTGRRPRDRRLGDGRQPARRHAARRRARVRRAHRRAALGLGPDPEQRRRSRARRLALGAGGARRRGNAWSILSVDPARDLVFVPTVEPEPGLLRRRAPRQQPLRELGRGAAREHRRAWSGASRWCTTISGTTTFRRSRC